VTIGYDPSHQISRRPAEAAVDDIPEVPIAGSAHPARRLYRRLDDRVFAGVASGIAGHLGVPVAAVRIAFVVMLGLNGLGALLYAVYWAVLPVHPEAGHARRNWGQMLPYLAIAIGVLILQSHIGWGGFNAAIGWLIAITAVGAAIVWHQAGPDRWRREPGSPVGSDGVVGADRRPSLLLRFVGGAVLVAIGIMAIVTVISPVSQNGIGGIVNSVLLAMVGVGAVALVFAPLLWRIFGQLQSEREARVREQERAELAAMVHDQVLHTLALIQRSAADPKTVLRLARGQERTLRNWLYKPTGSPSDRFAAAIEEVAAEVEDTYGIAVETVVVGDRAVDERVGALVAAAREALVNAARHAKVQTVSLYAEVEPELISVFVRDRGTGFDPAAVEENRHGVRGSIIGRMRRHGGQAEIHSAPGEGTEVRLSLPVTKEDAQ
jgi:signal transduction histidine kinase